MLGLNEVLPKASRRKAPNIHYGTMGSWPGALASTR